MRIMSLAAATVAFVGFYATREAQAARWCAYEGGALSRCGFASQQQCKRSVGRNGSCRREAAARQPAANTGLLPGQVYPSRPPGASPTECYLDDGYGRFRPCSSGGDGGGQR